MIKKLPVNMAIVPQETGWNCGPASAQIILQSRGINVSEAELAREIGTHRGGTDRKEWISDRSLNLRVPQAQYQAVWLSQDPPTRAQRDLFWDHLRRSINAGWGLVANWVAPPNNYPRPTRGSGRPNYGGGTVFHYVTYMGYAEDAAGQDVWVVDPGFRPFEFFVSRDQAETLMPPKGYLWASSSPPLGEIPSVTPPSRPKVNPVDLLADLMGNAVSKERYAQLLPAVQDALRRSEINNVNRIAMWMAQIGHESGGLRWMEEIASGEAYNGRHDLGNTQPGDGPRFKGRGPIQLTGRHNYGKASAWAHERGYVSSPTFFVDHPHKAASDEHGFIGTIWYWIVARPQINAMSDRKDLEGVTRAINGGLNGLADRRSRWERALRKGDTLLDILGDEDMVSQEEWAQMRRDVNEIKAALLNRVESSSRYRDDNEGARWQTVELLRNGDAMIHEQYAERLALLGDSWHVHRITRNARRGDIVAYAVFQRIPLEYLQENKIDPDEVEKEFKMMWKPEPGVGHRD